MQYRIEILRSSSAHIVWRGDVKVAILFAPSEDGEAYQLYPHPATFSTLDFKGLPAPLRPEFMAFPDLDAVKAFLGIARDDEQSVPMRSAA